MPTVNPAVFVVVSIFAIAYVLFHGLRLLFWLDKAMAGDRWDREQSL